MEKEVKKENQEVNQENVGQEVKPKKLVLTSNGANKLLKSYNEELSRVRRIENLANTYRISSNENPENVRPDYDFNATQQTIINIVGKIVGLKHAINKFNVETVLPCGLTIDQALVYLPILNAELDKLSTMKTRLPKHRCGTVSSNGITEYLVTNYQVNDALNIYHRVAGEIEIIQKELDVVNNTVTFEIE